MTDQWIIHCCVLLLQMSAGSQIQMAPQSTVNSGQSVHSQDSNMSTGKLALTVKIHCNDSIDPSGFTVHSLYLTELDAFELL